ncbi:MAG TPA: AIR synthase-related protein [archaeon]|nr:AIR synthase-related protein [archaeon]
MKYHEIVNYEKLDPFKRTAIEKFSDSIEFPSRLGLRIVPETLGESAIAIDFPEQDFYLAFNVEGLGTKNLIADAMSKDERGKGFKYYESAGIDTVAMSTNDLLSIGADAIAFGDIISSGNSDWFENKERNKYLLEGFKRAAEEIGMAIPCGETPTLKGIINEQTIDLAGASVGIIKPKKNLTFGQNLKEGDAIIGLESSGVHANGISLIRKTVESLPKGYFTELPSGKILGEEILTPTTLYTRAVIEMLNETQINYLSGITGHGWMKIMRAKKTFSYEIDFVPEKSELFSYLQEITGINDREAYYTWNMGIGYTVIAPKESEEKIISIAEKHGIKAFTLGKVMKGEKKVNIKPLKVVYEEN